MKRRVITFSRRTTLQKHRSLTEARHLSSMLDTPLMVVRSGTILRHTLPVAPIAGRRLIASTKICFNEGLSRI